MRHPGSFVARTILLVALTIIFLIVTVTLLPFSQFAVDVAKAAGVASVPISITVLIERHGQRV